MTGPKRTCAVPSTSLEFDEVPLVFKKPGWQLQVCLVSVLVTPLLYRLYLVLLTIGYALCSTRPCCNSNPPNPECPLVDLKWTGVFPCQLGWIGSTLAVVVLSAVFVTCYLLVTTSLKRWDPRKNIVICISLGVKNELFPSPKPSKLQSRVNSTNRLMLMPTLNICLLLLIFHLLLQSGDIESNPGPVNTRIELSDLHTILEKLMPAESKWFFIGLALGVHNEKLKSLQIKYQNDPQTCLREMLAIRLESACSPLTWADLCACLRCSTVDRSALADEIEKEFKDTDPSLSRKRSIEIVGSTLDTETPSKSISQFSDTQLKLSDLHTVFESLKFEGNPPPAKKPKPNEVMEEIGSSVSMDTQSSTKVFSAVEIYKTYLTKLYDIHHLPTDAKYSLQCEQRFINLKLIDKRKNDTRGEIEMCVRGNIDQVKKNSLSLSQIACKAGEAFPKLVLITGAPGVGKTTLSWELCRRWSSGEMWTHFNLVILLHLRDEGVRAATGLVDLLECGDVATSKSVKENILPTQGEGVLFLLEGFDELPKSLQEVNSIFTRLISGKLLPGSTVIVTTRPWASPQQYKDRIDQNIEILGFTPEQIKEYVDQKINEGIPDSIHTYLSANPHILTAMYNPLHARIVVEVYKEYHEQNKSEFPNTTTELYTAYSKFLMYRYLSDHPAEEEWNGELSELPQSLRPHFACLCEVAYKGLMKENNQQLVFFKEDVSDSSNTLGFMNSVHPLHRSVTRRLSPSYNFLHLTLQEFLAAFYIWTNHSPQQQLILFETSYKSSPMILQFLAGLTRFDDPWTKCVLPVPSQYSKKDMKFLPDKVVCFEGRHIVWLYEAQNPNLFTSFENVIFKSVRSWNASSVDFLKHVLSESLALGYCIAHGRFKLDSKEFIDDDYRGAPILPPFLDFGLSKVPYCNSRFTHLHFNCNDYSEPGHWWDTEMSKIPLAKPTISCTIISIYNQCAKFDGHGIKEVEFCEKIASCTQLLTKLEVNGHSLEKLTYCLSSSKAADLLSKFVLQSQLKQVVVQVPIIMCTCDDDEEDDEIIHTFNVCFGLSITRFRSMKTKNLFPSLPDEAYETFAFRIEEMLKHFADSLESFKYEPDIIPDFTFDCSCGSDALMSMIDAIFTAPSLRELHLNFLCVTVKHDRLFSALRNGLKTHTSLQKLTIWQDMSSLDFHILNALRENTSIKSLDISLCCLSDQVVTELCALVRDNIVVESISLLLHHQSDHTLPFIKVLEQLQSNTSLEEFIVSQDSSECLYINDASSSAICQVLKENKTLKCLKLPLWSASKCFLEPIAQALQKNSALSILSLDFFPATANSPYMSPDHEILLPFDSERREILLPSDSEQAVEAFGNMLSVNQSLKIVNLMVRVEDTSPIVRGLRVNKTVKELHVPDSVKESACRCDDYVHVRNKIVFETGSTPLF